MAFIDAQRKILKSELDGLKEQGLFKQERIICAPQSSDIEVEFPMGSTAKKVINMCANNYLGLSSHPAVVEAARKGLDHRGYGMSSVRFICGTQDIHKQLEEKLTEFLGTEDTILFPSCMDANCGVFEAFMTEEDVMIADRLVHASIVDGMRLCKAQQDTYKATATSVEVNLGTVDLKRLNPTVKLLITNKNISSTGKDLMIDYIKFEYVD